MSRGQLASTLVWLDDGLARICRAGLFVSFLVLMLAVLVQVVGRTFVHSSPVWTEELTRFALLYMTALGAGLAFRSGDLVNVDLLTEALPDALSRMMRLLAALAVALLCLLLLQPAWMYTLIGKLQTSPTLGVRMHFMHATMGLLLVLLLVFAMLRVLMMLFAGHTGRASRDV